MFWVLLQWKCPVISGTRISLGKTETQQYFAADDAITISADTIRPLSNQPNLEAFHGAMVPRGFKATMDRIQLTMKFISPADSTRTLWVYLASNELFGAVQTMGGLDNNFLSQARPIAHDTGGLIEEGSVTTEILHNPILRIREDYTNDRVRRRGTAKNNAGGIGTNFQKGWQVQALNDGGGDVDVAYIYNLEFTLTWVRKRVRSRQFISVAQKALMFSEEEESGDNV